MLAINLPFEMASQQSRDTGQSGGGAGSVLTSTQDVRYLEPASSLILKGSVVDVRPVGKTEVRGRTTSEMAASIRIQKILKGHVDGDRVTVRFALDPSPVGLRLSAGERDLFFLKARENGYVFVDPYVAKLPITGRELPALAAKSSPAEKVQIELLGSLSDPDPDIQRTALEQISRIGRRESVTVLHDLASSPDPKTKGMAYSGLMHLGDYSLLSEAIRFAESPTDDPDLKYWKRRTGDAIGAIGDNRLTEAREAVKYDKVVTCPSKILRSQLNRSVLEQLESLTGSREPALRESAVHALRGICDPSSAQTLARELDDPDSNVQYEAMMGLGALAESSPNLPVPSREDFDKNTSEFLAIWKAWWANTGRAQFVGSAKRGSI